MPAKITRPVKSEPQIFKSAFRGKKAWTRDSINKADYLLNIPEPCQLEIRNFIETLRNNPLQTEILNPSDYSLSNTKKFMERAKNRLETGVGFVILDRLSVKSFTKEELKAAYWISVSYTHLTLPTTPYV